MTRRLRQCRRRLFPAHSGPFRHPVRLRSKRATPKCRKHRRSHLRSSSFLSSLRDLRSLSTKASPLPPPPQFHDRMSDIAGPVIIRFLMVSSYNTIKTQRDKVPKFKKNTAEGKSGKKFVRVHFVELNCHAQQVFERVRDFYAIDSIDDVSRNCAEPYLENLDDVFSLGFLPAFLTAFFPYILSQHCGLLVFYYLAIYCFPLCRTDTRVNVDEFDIFIEQQGGCQPKQPHVSMPNHLYTIFRRIIHFRQKDFDHWVVNIVIVSGFEVKKFDENVFEMGLRSKGQGPKALSGKFG